MVNSSADSDSSREVGASQRFWDVAVACGLLSREESVRLSEESPAMGMSPMEIVRQRSILSPVQVDILEALLHPRETIPGYELLRSLGHGGMGMVFEARQLALGRSVALKTILVHRVGDATVVSRFAQEAKAIGRLHHPHIITAYDFGTHGGRLFLAMELVSGGDLEQAVREHGPMSEGAAWEFIHQAASGLEYAQGVGIIHRDIKPANLLLERKYHPGSEGRLPHVKIADFGLAFLQEDDSAKTRLTSEHAAVGSPQYMAPEQLEGGKVDYRADIYALGATAWHLLIGEPLYSGKNLMQILRAKVGGELPDPSELRKQLSSGSVKLLREMLALNPSDRPKSYAILLRRVKEVIEGRDGSEERSLETMILRTEGLSELSTLENLGKTLQGEHAPKKRIRGWGKWKWVLPAIAAGFLVIVWGISSVTRDLRSTTTRSKSEEVVKPNYVPGRMIQLYDGQTLNPSIWQITRGAWKVTDDEEGGKVISGKSGTMLINLAGKTVFGEKPFENYRFSYIIQPREGSPLNVQFGYGEDEHGAYSFLLSLEEQGIDLHVMRGSGETSKRTALTLPARLDWEGFFSKSHEIHLEKTPGSWAFFVDGILVTRLESKTEKTRPLIELSAGSKESYFSDFELWELVPEVRITR